MAVGHEDNDIDTTFNLGNQQNDGYTIAPYFGALLTDTWSVSFSFGFSNLDTDQFRTLPGTTTQVTSSPDHDRWFGMRIMMNITLPPHCATSGNILKKDSKWYTGETYLFVDDMNGTVLVHSVTADIEGKNLTPQSTGFAIRFFFNR